MQDITDVIYGHNGEVDMVWTDVSGSNELVLSLDIGVDNPGLWFTEMPFLRRSSSGSLLKRWNWREELPGRSPSILERHTVYTPENLYLEGDHVSMTQMLLQYSARPAQFN